MVLFLIYGGKYGAGREVVLSLYEVAKEITKDVRLILSKDIEGIERVKRVYPEAEFYNFLSYSDNMKLKKQIDGNIAFFAMISPKTMLLFNIIKAKKISYMHAGYDYAFFKGKGLMDYLLDKAHENMIKRSDLVVTTRYPIMWAINYRYKVDSEVLPHPPMNVIRKEFYEGEKKVELPFKKYFLYSGMVGMPYKGGDVLLKAVEGTDLNTVIAGRGKLKIKESKNIVRLERWISDEELYYLVKNAECTVTPYLGPAFSAVMTLSFVFGKPVIAPMLSGFDDWIVDGQNGWFFPSGDYNALREIMEKVDSGELKYSPKAVEKRQAEIKEKSKARLKEILDRYS